MRKGQGDEHGQGGPDHAVGKDVEHGEGVELFPVDGEDAPCREGYEGEEVAAVGGEGHWEEGGELVVCGLWSGVVFCVE